MNSPIFFDSLLGPVIGNINSPVNTLGKRIYEKIANFAINNSDVDLCEIKQLESMQKLIGIDLQDYNFPFPSDLQRLVNLFSCKQTMLKGQTNAFAFNYDKKQTISNPKYGRNLGTKLSIETSILPTSGFVVLYEKFGEVYSEGELTNPGVVKTSFVSGGTQVVPLSDISLEWGWPLVLGDGVSGTEVGRYYDIYTHIPGSDGVYYDGIIDWNSPFTTITKQQSSRDVWSNDDQIVDNMINYQLSLGLGILSADN